MTAAQAQELAELLSMPHMNGLRELSLDDNELESEGAVCLAKGVRVRDESEQCIAVTVASSFLSLVTSHSVRLSFILVSDW